MKSLIFGSVAIFILYFLGCTPSKETSQGETKKDSVYVFDSPENSDTEEIPTLEYPNMGMTYYVVQIGAFTTKDRAESFAKGSKLDLPYKINISYSPQNNLYVVQISPFYTSRSEAESVRNDLWKMEKYKDTWILTINK